MCIISDYNIHDIQIIFACFSFQHTCTLHTYSKYYRDAETGGMEWTENDDDETRRMVDISCTCRLWYTWRMSFCCQYKTRVCSVEIVITYIRFDCHSLLYVCFLDISSCPSIANPRKWDISTKYRRIPQFEVLYYSIQ